jgi:hypothetical protein
MKKNMLFFIIAIVEDEKRQTVASLSKPRPSGTQMIAI